MTLANILLQLVLHRDYIMYIIYVRPVGYRPSTTEDQISVDLVVPLDIRLIRLNSNTALECVLAQ